MRPPPEPDSCRSTPPGEGAAAALSLRVSRLVDLLDAEYGRPVWRPSGEPLSELVGTILSQHTSDRNSGAAFAHLTRTFPDWEQVRQAPVEKITDAIRSAGLANVKAPRIKAVLDEIVRRRGALDLSFLQQLDLAAARAWLEQLPGVGPKTAACVLVFALGLPALPVDTHVHRVSRRLGLIDERTTAEQAHRLLEAIVPSAQVYAFHVGVITHGRRVCIAVRPRCPVCVLRGECDYYTSLTAPTSPLQQHGEGRGVGG